MPLGRRDARPRARELAVVGDPKHVIGLAVLNNYTGGYWEDRGYNWFSGL